MSDGLISEAFGGRCSRRLVGGGEEKERSGPAAGATLTGAEDTALNELSTPPLGKDAAHGKTKSAVESNDSAAGRGGSSLGGVESDDPTEGVQLDVDLSATFSASKPSTPPKIKGPEGGCVPSITIFLFFADGAPETKHSNPDELLETDTRLPTLSLLSSTEADRVEEYRE